MKKNLMNTIRSIPGRFSPGIKALLMLYINCDSAEFSNSTNCGCKNIGKNNDCFGRTVTGSYSSREKHY